MTTELPNNLAPALRAFLDTWKRDEETIDFQHVSKKKDEKGEPYEIRTPWLPQLSLNQLIGTLSSWPNMDNYITAQRYRRWETKTVVRKGIETVVPSESIRDRESCIIDRVWWDSDPLPGKTDCLDDFPIYRKFQGEMKVDGHGPVLLFWSGRGWHTYFYADRELELDEARDLQDIVSFTFGIPRDPYVGITTGRMMRLPYSKNSRNNCWSLYVGVNMSQRGLGNATHAPTIEAHWDQDYLQRAPPEVITRLHPGRDALEDYRERLREQKRQLMKEMNQKRAKLIHSLVDSGATIEDVSQRFRRSEKWVRRMLSSGGDSSSSSDA
jgi:hypothetical protein